MSRFRGIPRKTTEGSWRPSEMRSRMLLLLRYFLRNGNLDVFSRVIENMRIPTVAVYANLGFAVKGYIERMLAAPAMNVVTRKDEHVDHIVRLNAVVNRSRCYFCAIDSRSDRKYGGSLVGDRRRNGSYLCRNPLPILAS